MSTEGPGLSDFIKDLPRTRKDKIFPAISDTHAYISRAQLNGDGKKGLLISWTFEQVQLHIFSIIGYFRMSNERE